MLKIHLMLVAITSLCVHFIDPQLSISIFLSSFCFNLYYRLLKLNFKLLLERAINFGKEITEDLETKSTRSHSVSLVLLSGLRTALLAAALGFLIIKIKIKLSGIVIAFILYKIVLLGYALMYKRFKNISAFSE